MARILNNISLNGNMAKVIELADEYVINGSMYDKSTFTAKPLEFCPISVSAQNETAFFNTLMIDSGWMWNRNKNNVLVDSNDPNIVWTTVQGAYMTAAVIRIKRTAAGIQVDTTQPYASNAVYEFISQDTQRVYLVCNRHASESIIFTVNKNTMAIELATALGNSRVKILRDTPGYIYFTTSYQTSGTNLLFVSKYNKSSGVVTTLLDDRVASWNVYAMVSDMEVVGNQGTFYSTKDEVYKPSAAGVHRNCIRKYVMNLDTEVVTASDVNLDVSILGSTDFATIADNSGGVAYELIRVEDNGKKYMTLAVYNMSLTNHLSNQRCAIWTFVMTDADNWKLVNYKKFYPILYRGIMPLFNNKMLILANEDGMTFYNWNTATQGYEKSNQYAMPLRELGVDMNNNIWVKLVDKSVELLSNTIPLTIYADFVKDEYEYNGVDINSQVEIYSQNYAGQYLTSNLELTLVGPVKFTDTGLKKKTITTTNAGKTQIPVTVFGTGLLSVNVKVL